MGCLTSTPLILSPLNLIFFTVYLLQNKLDSSYLKKANNLINSIVYFFIQLFTTVFIIILNLVCSPVCYIFNCISMIHYIFRKRTTLPLFLKWVLMGFPLIILSIFNETKIFWKYLSAEQRTIKENVIAIDKLNFLLMRKIFLDLYKKGEQVINLTDLMNVLKKHSDLIEEKLKNVSSCSEDSDELDDLNLENFDKMNMRVFSNNILFEVKFYKIILVLF